MMEMINQADILSNEAISNLTEDEIYQVYEIIEAMFEQI